MKSELLNISNIGSIIRNRAEPEYARAFADMYWRALLFVAVLTTIGACAFGVLQFFDALSAVSPDVINGPGTTVATKTIDRVKMQQILDDFASRVSGVQGLQTLPLGALNDPSK
jgi:hypothetical protein